MGLLLLIASAAALVRGRAAVPARAGLHLDGTERAIVLALAVECTAGNAAADIGIRLLLRHDSFLLNGFCAMRLFIVPESAGYIRARFGAY